MLISVPLTPDRCSVLADTYRNNSSCTSMEPLSSPCLDIQRELTPVTVPDAD